MAEREARSVMRSVMQHEVLRAMERVIQPAVLLAVERVMQRAVPLQAVPVEKGVRISAADGNGGMR